MSLLTKWLIPGVVAVAAVTGISLYSETTKIEADLTSRAENVLASKDMDWAAISFDGRDGVLTGIAPEQGVSAWAVELLDVEWGIREVEDETSLLAEQKPFTWGLERDDDKLSMIGYLPYDLFKTAADKIKAKFNDIELSSSVEAARGGPAGLEKVVDFSSDLLSVLPTAKVMLIDDRLTVSGALEDGNAGHVALYKAIKEKIDTADLGVIKPDLQISQPKEPAKAEPVEAKPIDGFAIKRTAEGVDLVGLVPSADIKTAINGLAVRKFGSSGVNDNLMVQEGELIAGLGSEEYNQLASAALQAVSRLGIGGQASLSQDGLAMTGGAFYEGALQKLQEALRSALPASLSLSSELSVAAPGEAVNPDECQVLLRSALEKNTILFDSGKASISADSFGLLDGLIYTAHRCPESKIQIEGHTDSDGDNFANQLLSEKRAGSVVDYLIEAGLSDERLEPKGFGETNPVAGNDTAEGKAKNRRIEFVILAQ
ncbi:OmpA family protein [Cohaesibacter celericrescens]|uniref:OmpA family protein n=1 Tax=Cohaesibacter celericrescens TaxID=2067669 RepID=UPI003566847D